MHTYILFLSLSEKAFPFHCLEWITRLDEKVFYEGLGVVQNSVKEV